MEKSVISILTLILAVVYVDSAHAATFEVPLKGNERILVKVPQGMLQITANPQLKSAKIQLSGQAQSDYGVVNEGGSIEIKKKDSLTKESFMNTKTDGKYSIEIQAPSMPLEVHLFEGQVNLSKWSKDSLIQLQKGKIISRDGTAGLTIYAQSGDVSISNHQGKVDLDAYKVQLTMKDINGDMNVGNFAGENAISLAKGLLVVSQDQGGTKITQSSGTLKFNIGKSTLSSQGFDGRIEGQTQEGPVNVVMDTDSELNVKSRSGRITVHSAKGSGAYVSLTSVEGDIYGPNYLKINRDSGQKSIRGHLNGDVQKGSIVVRAQEGSIFLR